jgi:hypothetical protein
MSETTGQKPATGDTRTAQVLPPDEISVREDQAADTLSSGDRQSVDRSAGEGMVGTPFEAATMQTQHVTGQGQLLTVEGTPVTAVTVDLQIVPPTWAGTLTLPEDCETLKVPGEYQLRLDDGRGGLLTVKAQASCVYTVEGNGPFESDS